MLINIGSFFDLLNYSFLVLIAPNRNTIMPVPIMLTITDSSLNPFIVAIIKKIIDPTMANSRPRMKDERVMYIFYSYRSSDNNKKL